MFSRSIRRVPILKRGNTVYITGDVKSNIRLARTEIDTATNIPFRKLSICSNVNQCPSLRLIAPTSLILRHTSLAVIVCMVRGTSVDDLDDDTAMNGIVGCRPTGPKDVDTVAGATVHKRACGFLSGSLGVCCAGETSV